MVFGDQPNVWRLKKRSLSLNHQVQVMISTETRCPKGRETNHLLLKNVTTLKITLSACCAQRSANICQQKNCAGSDLFRRKRKANQTLFSFKTCEAALYPSPRKQVMHFFQWFQLLVVWGV